MGSGTPLPTPQAQEVLALGDSRGRRKSSESSPAWMLAKTGLSKGSRKGIKQSLLDAAEDASDDEPE
eukprot:5577227-Amphidinium_carterae.1